MNTTELTTDQASTTLARVYLLVSIAGDSPPTPPQTSEESRRSMLIFSAYLLALEILALLPPGYPIDDDESVAGHDPLQLLQEAEGLTRAHPIEQFPAGTSQIIVQLLDLVRELAR